MGHDSLDIEYIAAITTTSVNHGSDDDADSSPPPPYHTNENGSRNAYQQQDFPILVCTLWLSLHSSCLSGVFVYWLTRHGLHSYAAYSALFFTLLNAVCTLIFLWKIYRIATTRRIEKDLMRHLQAIRRTWKM